MPLAYSPRDKGVCVCLWVGRARKLSVSPGVALRLDGEMAQSWGRAAGELARGAPSLEGTAVRRTEQPR